MWSQTKISSFFSAKKLDIPDEKLSQTISSKKNAVSSTSTKNEKSVAGKIRSTAGPHPQRKISKTKTSKTNELLLSQTIDNVATGNYSISKTNTPRTNRDKRDKHVSQSQLPASQSQTLHTQIIISNNESSDNAECSLLSVTQRTTFGEMDPTRIDLRDGVSFENGFLTIKVDDDDDFESIHKSTNINTNKGKIQSLQSNGDNKSPLKRSSPDNNVNLDVGLSPTKKPKTIEQMPQRKAVKKALFSPNTDDNQVQTLLDTENSQNVSANVSLSTPTKKTYQFGVKKVVNETRNFNISLKETPEQKCLPDHEEDSITINYADYGINISELDDYSPTLTENSLNVNKGIQNESNISCLLRVKSLKELQKTPEKIKSEIKRGFRSDVIFKEEKRDYLDDTDMTTLCEPTISNISIEEETSFFDDPKNCDSSTLLIRRFNSLSKTNFNNTTTSSSILISHTENDWQFLQLRDMIKRIWETVKKSHWLQVLSPEDKQTLTLLFELPSNYQEFCLRLFTRQSKWYQVDKFVEKINLQMDTIDLNNLLDDLENLQMIVQDYQNIETLETLLNYLLIPDLKDIVKACRLKPSSHKKGAMIKGLLKHAQVQRTLTTSKNMTEIILDFVKKKLGRCIKLNQEVSLALFRLELLFYFPIANITSHSELHMYLNDIKTRKVCLPRFKVTQAKVFENCEAFNDYAEAAKLYFNYEAMKNSKSKNKSDALFVLAKKAFASLKTTRKTTTTTVQDNNLRRFTPGHLYSKLLLSACTDFTKNNYVVKSWLTYLIAHDQLGTKRGECYVQIAMHLERYDKNIAAAVDMLKKGLQDDQVTTIDRFNLSQRAQSLLKRKKLVDQQLKDLIVDFPTTKTILTTIIKAKPTKVEQKIGRRVIYIENSMPFTVEEVAKSHYCRQGFPKGVHCEGSLAMSLFAALFWDIIYADVPGAFFSRFQYIPLDLYSIDFYLNRKEIIDERLKDIATTWGDEFFCDTLKDWELIHAQEKSLHSPQLIKDSLVIVESAICITRPKLAKILERLVKDVRQYQAGMPDLFMWNPDTKKCLFAEVKSHNDKLSMKQKEWLRFLQEIEVPAEVCLVNSIGAKNAKMVAK